LTLKVINWLLQSEKNLNKILNNFTGLRVLGACFLFLINYNWQQAPGTWQLVFINEDFKNTS